MVHRPSKVREMGKRGPKSSTPGHGFGTVTPRSGPFPLCRLKLTFLRVVLRTQCQASGSHVQRQTPEVVGDWEVEVPGDGGGGAQAGQPGLRGLEIWQPCLSTAGGQSRAWKPAQPRKNDGSEFPGRQLLDPGFFRKDHKEATEAKKG